MATKKKGKKAKKSKRTSGKNSKAGKGALKKAAPKKRTVAKKNAASSGKASSTNSASRRKANRRTITQRSSKFEMGRISRSAGQSGDLQGLRDTEGADSESVDELLEEGNAFEANVVAGVEHAEDNEEQEVHTKEVPEDDVPEEYLDRDS
jgi:hypothetical protein